ncbi:MAG: hypothetical protein GX819_02055 [Clostridiaceae bacterium]|nr:hypothetical protein [Clostridiaceae bacterium]
MKKIIVLALVAVLAFGLVACSKKPEAVKTGFGVSFSNYNSKDVDEGANGKVDTQAYAAGVMVDKDGKVVKCTIDAMMSVFDFNEEEILTGPETVFKTKNELGDDYGMRKASPIGKEWNEQAAAFAEYCVGKTAAEIEKIAVSDDGKATDADLASSVTVPVKGYQTPVLLAIANAVDLGAKATDKLGLGIVGTGEQTVVKGEEDKPATAVAYNFYCVLTLNADGKISSCYYDASQGKFKVEDGKITTDLMAEIKTKNALGDDYGMRKASPIEKEWDEQADAFAKYVTGKTVSDVTGMALKQGAPDVADLASSCTMHVTDMITALEKAAATAK